jgi:hypothetical protein
MSLNRRDYLKKLAAGAAGLAASQVEIFGQRNRGRSRRPQPRKPAARQRFDPGLLNWNITENRPASDAFVTAIFGGLMGFTYQPDARGGDGKVGIHGHSNMHSLVAKIYRYPGCTPHSEQPNILPSTKNITLQVMPVSNEPVAYYEHNPNQLFDRYSGDPDDFRWLPELDGADFYPENYDKHNDHFKKWLHIRNATFYTRMKTNSKFNLVTQESDLSKPNRLIKPYGFLARYMAAAIPLPAGGQYVSLQVDSQRPIRLDPDGGAKYQIVFLNECSACAPPSAGDLSGNDETRRGDFHFARKAVKVPGGRVKIALKLEENVTPSRPNFCSELVIRNTDAAPCMGAGYGGGNGPA